MARAKSEKQIIEDAMKDSLVEEAASILNDMKKSKTAEEYEETVKGNIKKKNTTKKETTKKNTKDKPVVEEVVVEEVVVEEVVAEESTIIVEPVIVDVKEEDIIPVVEEKEDDEQVVNEDKAVSIDDNIIVRYERALKNGDIRLAVTLQDKLNNVSTELQIQAIQYDRTLCRHIPNLHLQLQERLVDIDIKFAILIQNLDDSIRMKAVDIFVDMIKAEGNQTYNHNNEIHFDTPEPQEQQESNESERTVNNQRVTHQQSFNHINTNNTQSTSFGFNPSMIMRDTNIIIPLQYDPFTNVWSAGFHNISVSENNELLFGIEYYSEDTIIRFMNIHSLPEVPINDKPMIKKYLDLIKESYKNINPQNHQRNMNI